MASNKRVDILSDASNAVVAKHSGRNFPGLLIQGDTLRTILDDVEEIHEGAVEGDMKTVAEIAETLAERLVSFLSHYEQVLEEGGIEIPYSKLVRDKQ